MKLFLLTLFFPLLTFADCLPAVITTIVDGDTFDSEISLPLDISVKKRLRVYGWDAPETRTKDPAEKLRGLAATKKATETFALVENKVCLTEHGHDSFGRLLVEIKVGESDFVELMRGEK